jgi:hypothetical protein
MASMTQFFTIKYTVALLLTLSVANAAESSSGSLSALLRAFEGQSFSSENEKSLQVLKRLAGDFVADPQNAAVLKSSEGLELLRYRIKLENFFAIKETLSKCSKDTKRNLAMRILDAAGRARDIEVNCACQTEADLSKMVSGLKEAADLKAKNELQSGVFRQALKNSALTYLDLKFRYGKESVNVSTVLEICRGPYGKDQCSKETKAELLSSAQRYLTELKKDQIQKLNGVQIAGEINRRIDGLNESLKDLSAAAKGGWFSRYIWDRSTPEMTEKQSAEFSEHYVSQYLAQAASGPGVLLMTRSLRDKVGGLRAVEKADMNKLKDSTTGGRRFVFKPHQKISAADVEVALSEAQADLKSQSLDLLAMEADRLSDLKLSGAEFVSRQRDRDLGRLIRVNPQAYGQYLINHPEATLIVCDQILKVTAKDESDAKWRKAYVWGGMVVGAGLLVTGVGAGVGAWLMAGTEVAAGAATVSTVVATAGFAVGLTDVGYQSVTALRARQAEREFEAAVLSGNGDQANIQQARAALSDFNAAKTQAIYSLAFSTTDVLNFLGVIRLVRDSKQTTEILTRATRALNKITESPTLVKLFGQTKLLVGSEKLSSFLGYFSQISDAARKIILEKMYKWTPEQFRKTVEEALLLAHGCIQ